MEGVFQIAVDGPSGAGKSTVAKKVAAALSIEYIDTGAMYRAVGYKMLRDGIELSDRDAIKAMLDDTDIDFKCGETVLDGLIVSDKIRTSEVSRMASDASALPEVREKLVTLQRAMGRTKSVIMDGRDIGTNVFPNARYKFFLTASVQERARRRWLELTEKGQAADIASVEKEIAVRDFNDSNRPLNPLKKADDAVELDTTEMSIEEAANAIIKIVKQRNNS